MLNIGIDWGLGLCFCTFISDEEEAIYFSKKGVFIIVLLLSFDYIPLLLNSFSCFFPLSFAFCLCPIPVFFNFVA